MDYTTMEVMALGMSKLLFLFSPVIGLLLYYLHDELKEEAIKEAIINDRRKHYSRSNQGSN